MAETTSHLRDGARDPSRACATSQTEGVVPQNLNPSLSTSTDLHVEHRGPAMLRPVETKSGHKPCLCEGVAFKETRTILIVPHLVWPNLVWPNLVLVKLGLGQTWSWPNLVSPEEPRARLRRSARVRERQQSCILQVLTENSRSWPTLAKPTLAKPTLANFSTDFGQSWS